jgi:TolB protein
MLRQIMRGYVPAGILLAAAMTCATAQDITVVKSGAKKSVIDISGLGGAAGPAGREFLQVLDRDLERSGWFRTARDGAAIRMDGTCSEAQGELAVLCGLRNMETGRTYFRSQSFRGDAKSARRVAHEVCDAIVLAVTGQPGIASTRIVMVGAQGAKKDLYLCDADGYNLARLTGQGAVCLGPSWWPGGRSLTYTSFHGGFPDVYRIDLASGRRERIVDFPGLNLGADVSPDGRLIALTLSKDGNPDLYVINIASKRLMRLTRTRHAAEASPSWSPDGRRIVFVSDKSGTPQLYVTGLDGAGERRLTVRGSENVSPDWGPGDRIAYSSKREGRYHICILDPDSDFQQQLTSGGADHEDPSWAPDSRHIVYSKTAAYHSDLYVLDTLGDPELRLTTIQGDWYSPAWSPRD